MDRDFSVYECTLSAILLFGNAGLMIPFAGAKNGEFTAMSIAFLLSVLIYGLCFRFLKLYSHRRINKVFSYFAAFLLIVFCAYICTETARHLIDFISTDVLIKNRKIYCALAFLCVCIYSLFKGPSATAKFSGPVFAFVAVFIAVLFAIAFENFELNRLSPLFLGKATDIATRTFKYWAVFFVSPIVFAVFSVFYFKKPSLKTETLGLFFGFVMLSLCFLSAALTFSLPEAAATERAYSMSISVVSVGKLFTRMEGIAYFIFFFSAVIKVAVCGFSIKALLLSMNVKQKNAITVLLIGGAIAVSYIL